MSTKQQRVKADTLAMAYRMLAEINLERAKNGEKAMTMPELIDAAIKIYDDAKTRGEV